MTSGREVFLRFAAVGVAGFVVDATILYAVKGSLGLYAGRVVSYFAAATVTWALNRRFTFPATTERKFRQWALFLAANTLGAIVNYAVYAALVTYTVAAAMPILGVAAGSIAGLAFNFAVSKVWVFAER